MRPLVVVFVVMGLALAGLSGHLLTGGVALVDVLSLLILPAGTRDDLRYEYYQRASNGRHIGYRRLKSTWFSSMRGQSGIVLPIASVAVALWFAHSTDGHGRQYHSGSTIPFGGM